LAVVEVDLDRTRVLVSVTPGRCLFTMVSYLSWAVDVRTRESFTARARDLPWLSSVQYSGHPES
jgi:hypothetical protein